MTMQQERSGGQGRFDAVFAKYPEPRREYLIPLLQAVQESEGFLSREAVIAISARLNLPASKVYGVATFYNQFRFQAQGKFNVQVCRGTACHVKGSADVLGALQRALRIEAGQTTRDGLFSLEVVACIGACGLAPVITVDGEFHANMASDKIQSILQTYRRKASDGIAQSK